MKKLLFIICSTFVSLGSCQSNSSQNNCENEFKSDVLKMSVCMDQSWSQSVKGPWTIFSKDDMKISIYMEPVQEVEPIESKVDKTIKKDLNDTDYFGMKLVKKEKIEIDGIETFSPVSAQVISVLEPKDEITFVWDQIKNDGDKALHGVYKISSSGFDPDQKTIKKSITINIFK